MPVILAGIFLAPPALSSAQQNTVRWIPDQPGCEFAQLSDGSYRYALAASDVVVTVAVDSKELQKSQARMELVIALFVSIKASGDRSFEVLPAGMTLEFKKHYQEQHKAVNTDRLSEKPRKDIVDLDGKTAHELRRHSENKIEDGGRLLSQKQAITDMIIFLQSKSLQPAILDRKTPQASGWVFFEIRSRWIRQLDSQEEFILRVPVGQMIFEFPFVLPPSAGDINLRTRPQEYR